MRATRFNPRDINDQKLMRAINKRTTSMDVDGAGRIGLSESLRKRRTSTARSRLWATTIP
ncbi:MAG: hypothetical protein ACLRM9_03335 [Collinsella aerofaciens]